MRYAEFTHYLINKYKRQRNLIINFQDLPFYASFASHIWCCCDEIPEADMLSIEDYLMNTTRKTITSDQLRWSSLRFRDTSYPHSVCRQDIETTIFGISRVYDRKIFSGCRKLLVHVQLACVSRSKIKKQIIWNQLLSLVLINNNIMNYSL